MFPSPLRSRGQGARASQCHYRGPACLRVAGFCSPPVHGYIQISPSHPVTGGGGRATSPPLLLQNQPPTASACSLCSREQLLCALRGRCPPSPGLRACATNTVDVICSVLCVMRLAPCITLGCKFPPSQGGRGWRLKHHP